jgi:hypothetical protein
MVVKDGLIGGLAIVLNDRYSIATKRTHQSLRYKLCRSEDLLANSHW